jgi:hypothetical protein
MSGDQLVLTLLIALLGWCVLIFGHWVRLRDFEAQDRSRAREHSFDKLRWATELATSTDPRTATMGLAALRALAETPASWLDDRDVAAALLLPDPPAEGQALPRTAA